MRTSGRRGLFEQLRGDEPVLRRIQLIGFPVGIAGGLAYAHGATLAVAASVATAPLLTAAYVATLPRMMHSPAPSSSARPTHRLGGSR